ncbi:15-hydroxyprostaglandin dehydrogenase [NAD(+)] [Orussus abietinus]|uniref:15-hydroxyprostaglandin dehydrogenase [NAD(+)] n=1 Tax=Orussus abietinus TaxID=222816 RepID=UPI0006266EFD|nr:15-hydroxyprostaglandin dehydrogenase [NAD(+)] [Orussus abietinus]XP_012284690.1 15-hydroxyprostaglandin dehydrogenase [NAD(+)] [Orussus abietinus]XP_012284692.1 15-hydroxyprostaglandin dehydrogenase [NAD(+)] [Orussus abietinus]
MQIKDKRAIITGAASGLGLAFSRELLRNGAMSVVMFDIQETVGRVVAESLNSEFGGKRAIFVNCDVTKGCDFDAKFKETVATLGGVDIVINNAGIIDEINFNHAIDVNVTALIRCTLLGIQQMGKDSGGKGGVIVNVSSILGLDGIPQLPVHSATKHAVLSFSRSFAQPYHYQRTGVRIIVLCPGLTATPMMENLNEKKVTDFEELARMTQNIPPQRAESVAHGIVYMIRCAQNGSVWVSEHGKPVYEIQLPDILPIKMKEEFL